MGKKSLFGKEGPKRSRFCSNEWGGGARGQSAQGSHTSLSRQPVVSMGDEGYRVGARNSTVLFSS